MKVESKVTIYAVPVSTRLNRIRKWFNALFGFIKLGKRQPIGERTGHDRYRRMKIIASIFALTGIFYGALLILLGFHYGALLPENETLFGGVKASFKII